MNRLWLGGVVKPIWLLMIRWIVPPVRKPGNSDRLSVSKTIPCPVNAASPWTSRGTTRLRSLSLRVLCLLRTIPSTTGLTSSRWLGLGLRLMWIDFVVGRRAGRWRSRGGT